MTSDLADTERLLSRAMLLIAGGDRQVLGIAGAPGAGKSTLAAEIVSRLGPEVAVLVGMDGFHLDDDILREHGSLDRKGAIDTFDDEGYALTIERIAAARPGNRSIYAPRFDRTLEASIGGAIEIPAAVPLVVTEGNYLLAETGAWPRVRAALGEVWFLDIDDEARRAQLIARHRSFGRSDTDARERALGSDETNAHLITRTSGRADFVFRWRREGD